MKFRYGWLTLALLVLATSSAALYGVKTQAPLASSPASARQVPALSPSSTDPAPPKLDLPAATAETTAEADSQPMSLRAMADEGARLFSLRRYPEAAELLQPAAAQGYPQAQYQVGWMLYLGFGLPRDLEQATVWFRRAAEQGNTDGMNALGTALREGKGLAQDHAEALNWYRAAAGQGHAEAQLNVGFMHEMGYATPKDASVAARWYRASAEQNLATAQFYLGSLYGEGKGVVQDLALAAGWYRRAASQGNEYARLALQRIESLPPVK